MRSDGCGKSENPMENKNQIPIGMLITEVTFFPDESAELFGFWYNKEKTHLETREEKQIILTDLAVGEGAPVLQSGATFRISKSKKSPFLLILL